MRLLHTRLDNLERRERKKTLTELMEALDNGDELSAEDEALLDAAFAGLEELLGLDAGAPDSREHADAAREFGISEPPIRLPHVPPRQKPDDWRPPMIEFRYHRK